MFYINVKSATFELCNCIFCALVQRSAQLTESPQSGASIDFTGFRLWTMDSSQPTHRGRLAALSAALHLSEHKKQPRSPFGSPFYGSFGAPLSEPVKTVFCRSPLEFRSPLVHTYIYTSLRDRRREGVERRRERGNRYCSFPTRNSAEIYSISSQNACVFLLAQYIGEKKTARRKETQGGAKTLRNWWRHLRALIARNVDIDFFQKNTRLCIEIIISSSSFIAFLSSGIGCSTCNLCLLVRPRYRNKNKERAASQHNGAQMCRRRVRGLNYSTSGGRRGR